MDTEALFPGGVPFGWIHCFEGFRYEYRSDLKWYNIGIDPAYQGLPGAEGDAGASGLSAYQLAGGDGVWGTLSAWLASLKGAKGDTGNTGAASTVPGLKGDKGDKGDTGNNATISGVVTTPARAFDTVFQPSLTKIMQLHYAIDLSVAISLTAGQSVTVALLAGPTNPPTAIRDEKTFGVSGTLIIGINLTQSGRTTLSFPIPAGWYVKLTKSGTGTATLVRQNEVEY